MNTKKNTLSALLGMALQKERVQLKISKEDLSAGIKIDQKAIDRYEAGILDIPAADLYAMALFYKKTPSFFIEAALTALDHSS